MIGQVFSQIKALAVNEALAGIMDVVGEVNGYLERTAPWTQTKAGNTARVNAILYTAAESLRIASILLYPVMPKRMAELWQRLGWTPPNPLRSGLSWGGLRPGTPVVAGPPLFPREVG